MGQTGSQGEMGQTGSQGEMGQTGSQGEVGPTGAGIQGPTGSQGPTGEIGLTGPKGDTGSTPLVPVQKIVFNSLQMSCDTQAASLSVKFLGMQPSGANGGAVFYPMQTNYRSNNSSNIELAYTFAFPFDWFGTVIQVKFFVATRVSSNSGVSGDTYRYRIRVYAIDPSTNITGEWVEDGPLAAIDTFDLPDLVVPNTPVSGHNVTIRRQTANLTVGSGRDNQWGYLSFLRITPSFGTELPNDYDHVKIGIMGGVIQFM